MSGPKDREGQRDNTPNVLGQTVFIRRESEENAMAWNERTKAQLRHIFRRVCCLATEEIAAGRSDVEEGSSVRAKQRQYRLEAARPSPSRSFMSLISCGLLGGSRRGSGHSGTTVGINPNQQLAMYLHWMFRVNFLVLFCVMCTVFFVLVILFAALIIIAGVLDDECVRIGGKEFGLVNSEFADAFALSWTTFSTVGYGSTYPALGSENSSPTNCFFITFLCSLESLLGVLYSGFCGAILFGKVLRIQSEACVIFSEPIVIRYGSGVSESADYDNRQENDEGGEKTGREAKKIPCPVLEFRIVNRLSNEVGGEIMDATLNVVANVDANDTDPTLTDALDSDRMRYSDLQGSTGKTSGAHGDTSSDHVSDSGGVSRDSSVHGSGHNNGIGGLNNLHKFLDHFILGGKADHRALDEDPSARLVSKRIFCKMPIEASDHPFFKRVWLARHVLDETSPILKPKVRRQIRRNGGSWPDEFCTWNAIRNSLQFNQILVSLNGVSNVSASDVYAQKIYDFVDVNVGYQFVNLLYKDTNGFLKVDTDLINDVREQDGGGGEPLIIDE